jgi:hypothetical protein
MGYKRTDKDRKEVVRDASDAGEQWPDIKQQRMRLAKLLRAACDGLEDRLAANETIKPSLGDYLRLMQVAWEIEKETDDDEGPKEIKVTWVDPLSKATK